MELIANFLIIGLFGGIVGDDIKVPHWENLECEVEILSTVLLLLYTQQNLSQAGHKYLFSDELHSWDEARAECALYGGWLVNIGSVTEQNCLMKFGHSKTELSMDKWYWTDGTDDIWDTGHQSRKYC